MSSSGNNVEHSCQSSFFNVNECKSPRFYGRKSQRGKEEKDVEGARSMLLDILSSETTGTAITERKPGSDYRVSSRSVGTDKTGASASAQLQRELQNSISEASGHDPGLLPSGMSSIKDSDDNDLHKKGCSTLDESSDLEDVETVAG